MGKSESEIHNFERERVERLTRAALVKAGQQGLEDNYEEDDSEDTFFSERLTDAVEEYEDFKNQAINSVEVGNLSELVSTVSIAYKELIELINETTTTDDHKKRYQVEQAFFKFRQGIANFNEKITNKNPHEFSVGPRDEHEMAWNKYLTKMGVEDFDPEATKEETKSFDNSEEYYSGPFSVDTDSIESEALVPGEEVSNSLVFESNEETNFNKLEAGDFPTAEEVFGTREVLSGNPKLAERYRNGKELKDGNGKNIPIRFIMEKAQHGLLEVAGIDRLPQSVSKILERIRRNTGDLVRKKVGTGKSVEEKIEISRAIDSNYNEIKNGVAFYLENPGELVKLLEKEEQERQVRGPKTEGSFDSENEPKDLEEMDAQMERLAKETQTLFDSSRIKEVNESLVNEIVDLVNKIESVKESDKNIALKIKSRYLKALKISLGKLSLKLKEKSISREVEELYDEESLENYVPETVPEIEAESTAGVEVLESDILNNNSGNYYGKPAVEEILEEKTSADMMSPDLDVPPPATDGEAAPVAPDVVSDTQSPDTAPAPEPTPDDLPPVAAAPGSIVSPEDAARAERLRAVGINPDSPTHERVGFIDERKAERKSLANETMLARLSMDKCDEAYRQALSSYHKQSIKEKITGGIKNSFNGESSPAEHLRKLRKEADEAAEQYREKLLIQIEDRRKDRVLDTVLTADSDQIKTGLQNKLIVGIDAAEQKTILASKAEKRDAFINDWPKTIATVGRIAKLLPKNKKVRLAIGLAVASMTGATLGVLAVGAAGAGVVAASAALGGAAGAGRWGVSTALGMGAGAAVNKYEGKRVKSAGERLQILLTNSENSNTMSVAEARRAVMLANAQVDTAKKRKTAMTIGVTILAAGGSRGAMAAYDILSPSGVGGGANGGNSGGGEAVPKVAMSPASAGSAAENAKATMANPEPVYNDDVMKSGDPVNDNINEDAAENAVATVEHPEPVYNDDVMKAGNDPHFDSVTDAKAPFSLSESVSVLNDDPSGTFTKTVVSGIELQGLQTGSLELSSGQMLEVQKLADLTVKDILSAHPHMPNAQVERLLMDKLEAKFGTESWWQAAKINNVKIGSIEVVGVGDSVVKPTGDVMPNEDVMKNQMGPVNDKINDVVHKEAVEIKIPEHKVESGDSVSSIFKKNLQIQFDQGNLKQPEGVTREGLSKLMLQKFPELTNAQNPTWTLSPEDWKKLGISSGNPHLIRPGENIDVAKLLGKFVDPDLKIGQSGIATPTAEILHRQGAGNPETLFEKQIKIAQETPWKPPTETELDAAKAEGILDGTVKTPVRVMDENSYGFKPALGETLNYKPSLPTEAPRPFVVGDNFLKSPEYQKFITKLFGSPKNFDYAVGRNASSFEAKTYALFDRFKSYESPYESLKELNLDNLKLLREQSNEYLHEFADKNRINYETLIAWFNKIDQMKGKLPNTPQTTLQDIYSRSVAEDFMKLKQANVRSIKA